MPALLHAFRYGTDKPDVTRFVEAFTPLTAIILLSAWWVLASMLPAYTLASIPLMFSAAVTTLYSRPKLEEDTREESAGLHEGLGRLAKPALVLALLSTLLVALPRLVYGPGVYSVDTFYNIRYREILGRGKILEALQWQCPLYTLLVLYPATLLHCNPLVFDVVIPLVGLVLTGLVIYVLTRRRYDSIVSLVASVSTLAWLAPIYVYAGLQTALLALPPTYLLLERLERGEKPLLEAVVLALWHPWVSGYATLVYLVSCWFRRRRSGEREVLALLAGWIAYLSFRAFIGGAGIERTVVAVSRGTPLAWTILYYLGGTLQRPDVYVPLAATLLVSSSLTTPYWLLASVVTAFASILVPNTILAERILSATPLPAYTTLLLAKSGARKHLYLYATCTVATAVFILMLVKPISHPAYAP